MNIHRNLPYADVADPNGPDAQGTTDSSEDIVEIGEILQAIRRHWIGVVIILILGLLAAFYWNSTLTPRYTATATVLIDPQETRLIDREAALSGIPHDSASIDSQVEILRSRGLAERAVDRLELLNDPEFNPSLLPRGPALVSYLDPRNWFSDPMPRPTVSNFSSRSRDGAIGRFQRRLGIDRRGLTYAIAISFTAESPEKAALIANAVSEIYINDQFEARLAAARRVNGWISEQTETMREEVRVAEQAVADFARANNLLNAEGSSLNDQRITQINQQLVGARADFSQVQLTYNQIRRLAQDADPAARVSEIIESDSINQLRQQHSELVRREAEYAARYGERHPELINVRQEVSELSLEIDREVQRIIARLRNDVAVAQARVRSFEADLQELEQTQAVNNESSIQLRELERNAEVARTFYETYLVRLNETAIQQEFQASDARVISHAGIPLGSSFPNTRVNLALGAMISLILALAYVFVIEWIDRGIRTRDQVESILKLPQITAIPTLTRNSLSKDGQRLAPEEYVISKPLSAYGESLRSLRAALDLSNIDSPPKIVLVTSSLPNEGKTTTALSLARSSAASGAKTLLIDADLRHPSLHEVFDGRIQPNEVGLVNILADGTPIDRVSFKDPLTDLDILLGGPRPTIPADVLGSEKMEAFLDYLRDQYDFVVIDSAPVLPVIDSRILAPLVDTTVFIAQWHRTPKDAAKNGIRHLQEFGARIAGVALTQVDLGRQKQYGYGSNYYYYNRYRDYYLDK